MALKTNVPGADLRIKTEKKSEEKSGVKKGGIRRYYKVTETHWPLRRSLSRREAREMGRREEEKKCIKIDKKCARLY